MLTIAQCTDSFLPVSDGVGRISYAYARELAGRGHELYVVTPMVNGFYRGRHPFEILDYMGVRMPGQQKGQLGMANLDLHYLARADSLRFDVVHTHSPGSAGMEAVRLSSRLHVPLVGSFHPQYFEEYLNTRGDEKSAALSVHFILDYFNRCDEIWTVSEEARALLLEHGFSGRVEIMENGTQRYGLSPAGDGAVRAHFHLGEEPLLLYVGRIDRVKNVLPLLDTAALLAAGGAPFTLIFAGQGPDEETLRARAHALGLQKHVRFSGPVEDDSLLYGLYAAASLCLFPALNVSPGLVVREAAALGTPSLVLEGSTAAGFIRDGENGLV
ncbi:MAG: glycosyltransferase, partial [Clostridia bacterium]|nr:glycosyltransferase [Clostridia bacterium]